MSANHFKNIIGLDISDLKLRFVQLHYSRGKKIDIKAFGEISVPANLIVDGEIKNETSVSDLIKKMLSKPNFGKISGQFINASLPEKKIFIKVLTIPNVPDEEIRGAVAWGIEQTVPISLEQAYFDWNKIDNLKKDEKKSIQVVAAVAPKNIVESYTRVIENAGFCLINLENESSAIARCLIDQSVDVRDPVLIIDLGKSRTNIATYDRNSVIFTTTLEINGTAMTKNVADKMKLSFEDAEKAKKICGLDKKKGHGAIRSILEPIITALAEKINESLEYYEEYLSAGKKINTIILTGSVAQMVGLSSFLRERLKVNVIVGDPWSNLKMSKKTAAALNKQLFLSFSTAIGLSLKSI